VTTQEPTVVAPPSRARAPSTTVTETLPVRHRLLRGLALRDRGYQLLLLAVLLGIWEYAGRQTPDFTFAPPSSVVPAARDMIESGELQGAVGDSLVALMLGFGVATALGLGIGYAMGWWRVIGRTLDPYVTAMYVVPIASLVPVIVVWFGLGTSSRVIVIVLFALFEILLNAYAGVKNVDPTIIDVARTFGASRRNLLWKVVLPATLPFVFVGLRMGASRAVKGMVLAEMLFAVTGLGGLIIKNAGAFRIDKVLVVIITIAMIGILLTAVVQGIERSVMRWRQAPRAGAA
jgi:ABC-type nitrate/sulfonate/bicarbonate transport system permease component